MSKDLKPYSSAGFFKRYISTFIFGLLTVLSIQFAVGMLETWMRDLWAEVVWVFFSVAFMGLVLGIAGGLGALLLIPFWAFLFAFTYKKFGSTRLAASGATFLITILALWAVPIVAGLVEDRKSNVNYPLGLIWIVTPPALSFWAYRIFGPIRDDEMKAI